VRMVKIGKLRGVGIHPQSAWIMPCGEASYRPVRAPIGFQFPEPRPEIRKPRPPLTRLMPVS
jgi:hypothetical protein